MSMVVRHVYVNGPQTILYVHQSDKHGSIHLALGALSVSSWIQTPVYPVDDYLKKKLKHSNLLFT